MTQELLYDGHGWRITLESAPLPDGRVKTAGRGRRADTVHILAFPTTDTLLLLREFRPFYGAYVWMLPSGKIDKEADPLLAAQRELREETGFRAEQMEPFCTCHHAEGMDWTSHLYLARDLRHDPLPQDATELIEVHPLPLEEALQRILSSEKVHTASAYGLLRYLRERARSAA